MRNVYLVSYDISDPKRWRQVYRIMNGFGTPLHYSVFRCDLTRTSLYQLIHKLLDAINAHEDRFLVADLGPVTGMGPDRIQHFGRSTQGPIDEGPALVF